MAQLIKLEDYVSRYQYDMYRYPSQFSRLKKERWVRLKNEWELANITETSSKEIRIEEKKPIIQKLKNLYKREESSFSYESERNESAYRFKYSKLSEVKTAFLKELYEFQLNWASSTLREISTLKKQHFYDETLKWLLQSFPDNYFVLYYPSVTYPKATIQFDIILVGPTDIWCIVNLRGSENTIFQKYSDRYWLELHGETEKKVVNPFLSLNRMSTVIKRLLADAGLDMSVKKVVFTKKGYIDVEAPFNVASFIDQRTVIEWHEKLKNNPSPIKSVQLKFSQHLLDYCQTTSQLRYDLEEEDYIEEQNIDIDEF